MKFLKKILLIFSLVTLTTGCGIVKKIAGADIDPIQFEKARQAKALEIREKASVSLARKLADAESLFKADVTVFLNKELIGKLLSQYNGTKGKLDQSTSYEIKSIGFKLYNGCAIASLIMNAASKDYSVDVALTMDCLIAFEQKDKEIELKLEPFNISPEVSAKGWFSSADEIIKNLIKINLGDIGKNFPPMKIPVTFDNSLTIAGTKASIKDKINLDINSPQRKIDYRIVLKDALIFEDNVFLSMNLDKIEVK